MGDTRFQAHYDRLRRAEDATREMYSMDDEALIQALAGGSADPDSQYLMNILASEALNRVRRARLVQQHLAEGVFALDGEGRIMSANPAAQQMLARVEAQLRGIHLYDLCDQHLSGDRDHVCAFMRVYEHGKIVEHSEETFVRADGALVEVAYTAAPVVADDLVAGVVVAWRDVGRLLEWQRRIVESEARYRSLFEHSSEIIVSVDLDGRVTAVNPAAERVTGYRAEAVVGMRVLPFVRQQDRARAEASLEAVMSGQTTEGVYDVIDAHGGTRTLEFINVPIVVGSRVVGVHAVARDVTESRRHERELEESEMRHRLAAEGLRDEAVIFLSPTGTILSWSPGAFQIFGWREGEMRGASYARLFARDEPDAEAPERQLERAVAGDLAIQEDVVCADGQRVGVSGVLRSVRGTTDTVAGYVLVLRRRPHEDEGTVVVRGDLIEAASAVFARHVGSTPTRLVARPFQDLLHPDDRERMRRTMQDCGEGQSVETELRLLALEGEPRRMAAEVRCLDAGAGEPCWVILCREAPP